MFCDPPVSQTFPTSLVTRRDSIEFRHDFGRSRRNEQDIVGSSEQPGRRHLHRCCIEPRGHVGERSRLHRPEGQHYLFRCGKRPPHCRHAHRGRGLSERNEATVGHPWTAIRAMSIQPAKKNGPHNKHDAHGRMCRQKHACENNDARKSKPLRTSSIGTTVEQSAIGAQGDDGDEYGACRGKRRSGTSAPKQPRAKHGNGHAVDDEEAADPKSQTAGFKLE